MFNKYKIDPETGLPKLPTGAYWMVRVFNKVFLSLYDSSGVRITVVEVSKRYARDTPATSYNVTSRDIRVAANRIMRKYYPSDHKIAVKRRKQNKQRARIEARNQRILNNEKKFSGNYPPNKL